MYNLVSCRPGVSYTRVAGLGMPRVSSKSRYGENCCLPKTISTKFISALPTCQWQPSALSVAPQLALNTLSRGPRRPPPPSLTPSSSPTAPLTWAPPWRTRSGGWSGWRATSNVAAALQARAIITITRATVRSSQQFHLERTATPQPGYWAHAVWRTLCQG